MLRRRLPFAIVLATALGSAGLGPAARADPPAPSPAASAPAPAVDKAPIEEAIARLAADVQRMGGSLSVSVVDVATGATIASADEGRALNPASNAKLATAAAALHVLGASHRFQTGLYGRMDGDVVNELVVRGDGDPSLRTADLWAMASELRSSGVRHVKTILVDQSHFDDLYVPPAFEQQPGEWATFRAPVAAVSLNENTVTFSILGATQGKDAHVDVDPPGFVELSGNITTTRSTDPEKATIGLEGHGTRITARLVGSVPENGRVVRLARRVDDPHLLAGFALRTVLREVGVDVRGASVKRGGEGAKRLLVAHRSATLGELLIALGKDSDNFYAEMLLKAIGAKTKGRPASAAAGAEGVVRALGEIGVSDPTLAVKNGSGLFEANRISAGTTTRLLRAMLRDPAAGPEFVAQLSIGGADGTLRGRFRDWESTHAIRAKTGTLDAVAALSGYVLPPPGRGALAYSVLVNGIPGKVAVVRPLMDRIVDAAAREVWKGVLPADVQAAATLHP